MPRDFLHNHPQFADLIRIVAEEEGIDPALVEKDYWIMHCLYGLQELGFIFQLLRLHLTLARECMLWVIRKLLHPIAQLCRMNPKVF
jgi:hypothetical protein